MTIKEYNHCVELYSDALYRFVSRSGLTSVEPEDVVQDVFEKLWKKRDNIDNRSSKALLFKMAHNRIIDIARYAKVRRAELFHIERTVADSSRQLEAKEMVEKAFTTLSHEHKSLVMLRDYEGHSYEEISKILDLSLSKVKVYLFRARKQMREAIKSLECTSLS